MSNPPNPPEIIWSRYEENPASGCWEYNMSRDRYGYGQISINGWRTRAHRIAFELAYGPLPEGMTINHKCAVRHCINPDHLEVMTPRENSLDAVARRPRPIECKYGHRDYGMSPSGYRWCHTCDNEKKKRRNRERTQ